MIFGILALVVLIMEGSVLQMFSNGAPILSLHTTILLIATLINLSLGSYLSVYRYKKMYIQTFASLLILTTTLLSFLILFTNKVFALDINFSKVYSITLLLGVFLHTAVNLKSLNLKTTNTLIKIENDNAGRESGTVKWFNLSKGFGFITRDLGEDVFVHYRAIRGEGHRILTEGQKVEFCVIKKDKGLQAEDVIIKSIEC